MKLLIENAITSEDYHLWILLMDMSKAFDTVRRLTLLEDLRHILKPEELHLCKLLIEDVQLSIRCGCETGEPFTTKQGIAQGDCLSAIFFILYLSKALGHKPHLQDHNYCNPEDITKPTPTHMEDHDYDISERKLNELYRRSMEISVQYADDCGYAIVSETNQLMKYRAATIPQQLKQRNLTCNETKNEDYHVTRKGTPDWKTCKYLGSLFDTEHDIKRRKILTLEAMKTMEHTWKNKLSLKKKLRIFNACVAPIFLSNSELWTTTKSTNGQIDAFQRRLLRQVLNIRYPKKMSNEKLQEVTKQDKWSHYIATQRLRWLGHVLRLPEDSPAKQALAEIERPVRKPRGSPKLKWITIVKQQLNILNISWEQAQEISQNRHRWRQVVLRWKVGQHAA